MSIRTKVEVVIGVFSFISLTGALIYGYIKNKEVHFLESEVNDKNEELEYLGNKILGIEKKVTEFERFQKEYKDYLLKIQSEYRVGYQNLDRLERANDESTREWKDEEVPDSIVSVLNEQLCR